jgi:two-component system, LytTR family, sensor kinase
MEHSNLTTMKLFWRFIFPILFGLLIYISIRLVTDIPAEENFWKRPVTQNAIEIFSVIGMSYLFDALLRYAIHQFNKRKENFNLQNVAFEFGILLLICILLINPCIFLIHYLINDPIDLADVTIANIIVALYVLLYYAIARGNSFIHSYVQQQTQIERLKNDQLQTELKFLKAQYHPHFLFNALNTIYFQMDENVPAAKQTVEKFSELLRYQLYDQQQFVTVKQELEHLQNFIHLQKQRTSKNLKLEVCFDEELNYQKIYPLLLLPLVENAFKYVGGNYELNIKAKKENNNILFCVRNSIPEGSIQKGGGIGLENLQRRLELLYPQKHQFTIHQTGNAFTAELKLQLNEN